MTLIYHHIGFYMALDFVKKFLKFFNHFPFLTRISTDDPQTKPHRSNH